MLQFDKRTPFYEQIVEYVKQQIVSGEWKVGSDLPSRREFASQLQVNPNTVQRAFREMEDMGLITTKNNVSSKVTSDEKLVNEIREEMIERAIQALMKKIYPLRISKEQLLEQIERAFEKEGDE